jgi:uncharacterized membrane protein
MTETEFIDDSSEGIRKLPLAAALVALVGLADSVYLSVKHFTAEPVPCSIVEGCEQVLTSSYAEIAGVPIAALGAAAYFLAFSLAILAAYGNRSTWTLFGVQALIMAAASAWLIYLQAAVIGAFCQFCLLSAATSFTLFIIFLASKYFRR